MAIINGTTGDDVLNGTTSSDEIFGDAGDDQLNGQSGADTVSVRLHSTSTLPAYPSKSHPKELKGIVLR